MKQAIVFLSMHLTVIRIKSKVITINDLTWHDNVKVGGREWKCNKREYIPMYKLTFL